MTTVYEIRQLSAWLRGVRGAVQRATFRAYARTLQTAERDAKINARNNFRGTRIRPKTGNLMNSIFSGYVLSKGGPNGGDLVDGVVGVKSHKGRDGTRPYGRIHEYGGVITPKRAKYLWQPLFGPKSGGQMADFRDMTPTAFVKGMKTRGATMTRRKGKDKGDQYDVDFAIITSKKGNRLAVASYEKRGNEVILPLFILRKSSTIPPRPYVRPAVEKAHAALPGAIAAEVAKTKPKPEGGE